MEIIRGRLSAADFSNPRQRYNPTTDTIQYTPDDGANWYDTPEADPRHSSIFRLPPLTGGDPQCDAAANMVKWIKDFIDSVIAQLDADATALALTNDFLTRLTTLFPPALLLLLLQEAATSLFDTGATALAAAFTSTQYDLLLCAFYCNIESDGTVTAADLVAVETQIAATMDSGAAAIVDEILFIQGEVGLSNAGATGSETGDCSGCNCAWCYEWDFLTSDGGWTGDVIPGLTLGHWVSGQGWVADVYNDGCSAHAYVYIQKNFGVTTSLIETFEADLDQVLGGFDAVVFNRKLSGSVVDSIGLSNGSETTHHADFAGVSQDACQLITNHCNQGAGYAWTKARVKGFGTMPAFTGGAEC